MTMTISSTTKVVTLDGVQCRVWEGQTERGVLGQANGSVRALGRVSTDMLHHLYSRCRLVCAPSVAGESFGLVLLEAFAHGRPVAAFQIPGYAELVGAHPVARLVPVGDSRALAAAIAAMCGDPAAYERMSSAARELAAAHGWARIGPRLVELYTAALGGHRRGRG